MLRGQWANLARMPRSHLYSVRKTFLDFFMTTESRDLGLTSHLKDGAFDSLVFFRILISNSVDSHAAL